MPIWPPPTYSAFRSAAGPVQDSKHASTPPARWTTRLPRPGLLLGLELKAEAKRIVNILCARHGILTGLEGPQGNVLKLRPPLSFRRMHADLLIAAIDATLSALRGV